MSTERVPLLINGKECAGNSTYEVLNPATSQTQHLAANADVNDVNSAIDAAAAAFETWGQSLPATRRDIFLKAANIMDTRSAELISYMKSETGADDNWAGFILSLGKECLLAAAGKVASIEGRIPTLSDPAAAGLIVKEPYGVVAAMAPWNAPYALGLRAIVWPIAAGNTVVFKGSELSPRCFWACCSVLQEAGLPDGVINFISCDPANAPAATTALISNPLVRKVNFTGSTKVGRIVAKLAGENLKPLLLELGGKAPAIVCDDADLDAAAQHCILGAFMYAGQICMSTERILVHESIDSAFQSKLREWSENIFSSKNDAPVLIQPAAVERNKALLRDAQGKGATIIHGNYQSPESGPTSMRPIIIGGVNPEMTIYKQESFGPTVSVMTYQTDAEALRIANDTEYGLSAAVFSSDLRRALRIARKLETGAVHINRMSVHDESALPHGGAKSSGFGRFNGEIDEWVRTKNITFDM